MPNKRKNKNDKVKLATNRKVNIFGVNVDAPDVVPGHLPTLFKTFREAEGTPNKEFKRSFQFRKRFEEIEEFQAMQESLQSSGRFDRR